MARKNKRKYDLSDMMGVPQDHRLIEAVLLLANEHAEQNKHLKQLIAVMKKQDRS